MHSYVSTVHNVHAVYIAETTLDQCKSMHKTGTLIINVNNAINGLKVNQTISRPIIFAGSVTIDGKCSGTQYSDPYGSWQDVVVQGIITVTLTSHRAMTNIETNQIHLKTGTTCQYSDVIVQILKDDILFGKLYLMIIANLIITMYYMKEKQKK